MVEEERKYDVADDFRLPELTGCLPRGGRVDEPASTTLTATYYDTADLCLARTGASLRFRRGDAQPWTVKLPAGAPGVRHEISRAADRRRPPADLLALVTAVTRGRPVRPVTTLLTIRRAYELRGADGTVLAEIADDAVSVLDGRRVVRRFREIEVERKAGRRRLLDRIERVLLAAGATTGVFTPKHVRALGEPATRPPDVAPPEPLPTDPTAGQVVVAALRQGVTRILDHDPLVRLRAPVGADDTAVHQMRVGCRRLRSDLRTFAPLIDPGWAHGLRDELRWLADVLGAARDAEVLRDRLIRTVSADRISPVSPEAVARMDAELADRHDRALVGVDAALASARYLRLVESLVDVANAPRLTGRADRSAADVLPRLVAKPWRRLAAGRDGEPGAGALEPDDPDGQWHSVRIRGKRVRYAMDAVAPVLGGRARKLARRLAAVQELLGEHQDAATAADVWLEIADANPTDHTLAVAAGRLVERERAAIRAVRARFPAAWRAASRPELTGWLS